MLIDSDFTIIPKKTIVAIKKQSKTNNILFEEITKKLGIFLIKLFLLFVFFVVHRLLPERAVQQKRPVHVQPTRNEFYKMKVIIRKYNKLKSIQPTKQ